MYVDQSLTPRTTGDILQSKHELLSHPAPHRHIHPRLQLPHTPRQFVLL